MVCERLANDFRSCSKEGPSLRGIVLPDGSADFMCGCLSSCFPQASSSFLPSEGQYWPPREFHLGLWSRPNLTFFCKPCQSLTSSFGPPSCVCHRILACERLANEFRSCSEAGPSSRGIVLRDRFAHFICGRSSQAFLAPLARTSRVCPSPSFNQF